VEELQPQGVTAAVIIHVRDGDSRRRTNTVVLTFLPLQHAISLSSRTLLVSFLLLFCFWGISMLTVSNGAPTNAALEGRWWRTSSSNLTSLFLIVAHPPVTGQLADKSTRGQSSRGLDNSRTGQLGEMFDLKFGVYNSSECYFGRITLFIPCQYSIGLE